MKDNRVWVVIYPKHSFKGSDTKIYYSENVFMKNMELYSGRKVTVKIYRLESEETNKCSKFYDDYISLKKSELDSKRRDITISNLINNEDNPQIIDYRGKLIEYMKKYSPNNIFINDFEKVQFDNKRFISLLKSKNNMVLYHITNSVEYFETLLNIHNFKSIDQLDLSKETLSNFNKAKENIKLKLKK